jgi:hypothetical protein
MGAGQGGKNRILNRVKILKLLKLDLQQIDENCTFFFDERDRNINLEESFGNTYDQSTKSFLAEVEKKMERK